MEQHYHISAISIGLYVINISFPTYDALKTYVPQMVELLVDCAKNQAFKDWEYQKVKAEITKYANNPEALLLEAVHST
ncbi:mitochondrial-processing peptidase subunit alpha-like protein [Tanacetum coccineum]